MRRLDWVWVVPATLMGIGCGSDEPATKSVDDAGVADRGLASEHVFDPEFVRHFDVRVDPTHWEQIKRFPVQENYVEGRLEYDGELYEHVGLRFKGFRGSLYNCFQCCSITDTPTECPGPEQACYDAAGMVAPNQCEQMSYKLSFTAFEPKPEFFGLRRLNFHNTSGDASFMRERLAYHLLERGGIDAPRAVHATLSVNGESLGLFTLVEQIDARFARYRFDDGGGGNVYKERWPSLSTDPAYYRSGLSSNEAPNTDVSPIVAFAEAVQGATESNIVQVLERHTDLESLVRYLAVGRAVSHWDGPLMFRCNQEANLISLPDDIADAQRPPLGHEVCQNKNFYWYERSDDGRLVLIPWDVDNALSRSAMAGQTAWFDEPAYCPISHWFRPSGCDPLVRLLALGLRDRVVEAGEAFLTSELTEEQTLPVLRAWEEQLARHVMEERGVDADTLHQGVDGLLGAVLDSHQRYRDELDSWQ